MRREKCPPRHALATQRIFLKKPEKFKKTQSTANAYEYDTEASSCNRMDFYVCHKYLCPMLKNVPQNIQLSRAISNFLRNIFTS